MYHLFVVASSVLLVARHRSGTLFTIVVAEVAVYPAVVVVVATGGLDACSAEFLAKVSDGNLKLGKVLMALVVSCEDRKRLQFVVSCEDRKRLQI